MATIPQEEKEKAALSFLCERTNIYKLLESDLRGIKVTVDDGPPFCIRRCAIERFVAGWTERN